MQAVRGNLPDERAVGLVDVFAPDRDSEVIGHGKKKDELGKQESGKKAEQSKP